MKFTITFFILFVGFAKNIKSQNNKYVYPEIELWQQATVSIGNLGQKTYDGKSHKYYKVLGTGMIAYVKYKKEIIPVIITAKHVIQNKKRQYLDTIRVRFSWENERSVYNHLGYRIVLKKDSLVNYVTLPDSSIDLACIPMMLIDSVRNWEKGKIIPYSKFAADTDYFEGRDIYTLGYPEGIGVEYLTKGLLRKGIISWLPDSAVERRKFLIDCNVYPGNSGGPVFSFPAVGSVALDTLIMSEKFLGIVVQRRFNYNEIFEITGNGAKKRPEYLSPESMGVGVVEPAKNVLRLLLYTEEIINRQ